jgi:hypothetical protein
MGTILIRRANIAFWDMVQYAYHPLFGCSAESIMSGNSRSKKARSYYVPSYKIPRRSSQIDFL